MSDTKTAQKKYSLVIVESPAKAKTIGKYLGSNYKVKSSVGHIRDLASNAAKKSALKSNTKKVKLTAEQKLAKKLSVDPYNNWVADYQILPGKEKVLKDLKSLSKKADTIYLATDLDREGEAIAWHLKVALGGDEQRYKRVMFAEITKNAIQKAFEKPGVIKMNRVQAQQTRRFLDRVVGFMVSPLLWQKVARGLSAGRVQSVAVRLIVEREKEIKAFEPETFYEMEVDFCEIKDLKAKVVKYKQSEFRPLSKSQLDVHIKALDKAEAIVHSKIDKIKKINPKAAFITSTLQQAASTRLGFSVKKTMTLAQRLYEAGHITYMRTDSTFISTQALQNCRNYIKKVFGDEYLSNKINIYQTAANAQEAHEAIRPTNSNIDQSFVELLEKDQQKLYKLIFARFIACQMSSQLWDTTTLTIKSGDYTLRASNKVLKFDGFSKVFSEEKPLNSLKKDDNTFNINYSVNLKKINHNHKLNINKLYPSEHTTKPKPRFSEARFVSELEKRGIGRPSTYATIISTIQERGYVKYENKRFYALKMGEIVTMKLSDSFEDLMDYNFTAKMENQLDEIAKGALNWTNILDNFFEDFVKKLNAAQNNMPVLQVTKTEIKCDKCNDFMLLRTATTGMFIGCANYQKTGSKEAKISCKTTINLKPIDDYEDIDSNNDSDKLQNKDQKQDNDAKKNIKTPLKCQNCVAPMDEFIINETTKLYVCSSFPKCTKNIIKKGKFKVKGYDGPTIICDRCSAKMQLKTGRFGKYFACTACPNTRKLLKNGEVAPPKAPPVHMLELKCEKSDGYFVLRDGAAGIFLASSSFPKSRETKKPRVIDLYRHKDELDKKFLYLAEAPQTDPEGNYYLIKFSRKNKKHFLASTAAKRIKSTKGSKQNNKYKSVDLYHAHYENNFWHQKKALNTKTTPPQKKIKNNNEKS